MTPDRYVRISRAASAFFLTGVSIIVGLAVALVAAVISPVLEQAMGSYGILSGILWATLVGCAPAFMLSVLVGAFGKCPSCGARFVSARKSGPKAQGALSRDVRKSWRTAMGYECRCEACSRDALKALRTTP